MLCWCYRCRTSTSMVNLSQHKESPTTSCTHKGNTNTQNGLPLLLGSLHVLVKFDLFEWVLGYEIPALHDEPGAAQLSAADMNLFTEVQTARQCSLPCWCFLHMLSNKCGVGHPHQGVGQRDDRQEVLRGHCPRQAVRPLTHNVWQSQLPTSCQGQLTQQGLLEGDRRRELLMRSTPCSDLERRLDHRCQTAVLGGPVCCWVSCNSALAASSW